MNTTAPLVSIIIPAYNLENYIAETIKSALDQTWNNIEVIIVDDGSKDNTLAIAKSFESERVHAYHQDNKGASAARNLGLAKATGDYIQYLDADDLLSKNKIETQLIALQGDPNKIAICPTVYFLDGENPFEQIPNERDAAFQYATTDTLDFLLNLYGINGNGSMVTIHSWLTHRSIIEKAGPWNEQISVDDDGEYFCRVVLKAQEIVPTYGAFNYYRKYKNGTNLAGQASLKAMESTFKSLVLKEGYLLEKGANDKVQKTFALAYFKLAVGCYPKYKALSRQILQKALPNLEETPQLFIGSKFADIIANKISWRLAKRIQYLKDKFRK